MFASDWSKSHLRVVSSDCFRSLVRCQPFSLASNTKCWTPPMMPDYQNPHCVAHDTEEKMVRKSMQIDAAKVALANRERLWPVCGLLHEVPQLAIKVIGKLGGGDALVILHNLVDVGVNLRMQDKLHQLRRAWICWSSCSREMPMLGFASNSASRRNASALPSSSSWSTDGSDLSKCAARTAL